MIRVLRGLRVYLVTMNTLHHHSYYSERKIGPASPRGSQEWVKNMGSRVTSRWRQGRGEMEASFQGWDKGLTWMLKDNQGADGSPGNLWPHNDAWWRWKLCSLDPSPALPFTLSIHLSDLQLSSVQLLSRVRLFVAHRLQHTRPPRASPTPGVYSNSCPSSRWCHPTISSSVIPFSSPRLQSFPASGSF